MNPGLKSRLPSFRRRCRLRRRSRRRHRSPRCVIRKRREHRLHPGRFDPLIRESLTEPGVEPFRLNRFEAGKKPEGGDDAHPGEHRQPGFAGGNGLIGQGADTPNDRGVGDLMTLGAILLSH